MLAGNLNKRNTDTTMALREIKTYPDPVLRKETAAVKEFNDELRQLITDMIQTMYAAPGVGLAANQIGVSLRVAVVDITKRDPENDLPFKNKEQLILVNPRIVDGQGAQTDEEGCLSVVDMTANVKRFQKIMVQAQDLEGKKIEIEVEDFLARVIQHEVDHLDGVLFIDRISALKRAFYKKRRLKQLKEQQEENG